MASLLGNLIYTGLQTLLNTQAALGQSANLWSINTGALDSLDTVLFNAGFISTGGASTTAQWSSATLPVSLYTRTGAVCVLINPNTTVANGELLAAAWHTRIQ
ncbi:MAG: hypothetical protein EPN91_08130 [Salinibacterium sp.]|nr:MAG: hypothetical protein EPN91_08130 [Salinibacterium sp.]